jgi:hypothetical protein
MLYLLDSNVLIDADRDYYDIKRVPEFWSWLVHQGQTGNAKLPIEMFEEITDGKGQLVTWIKQKEVKKALVLDETSVVATVNKVTQEGYAKDLTDIEIVTVGRDPFLVAHAMKDPANRRVVTSEPSAPSRQRQNRRIPDVCKQFGVSSCTPFQFYKDLNFSTSWKP